MLQFKAPDNHVIVLKYIEKFHIEPSNDCTYDYMEIRDGRYGYSRLIGRYCDSNPLVLPLESSGKELWIKFNTDESIQHDGFKIVYEFKKFTRDLKNDFSSKLILASFFCLGFLPP